MVNEMPQVLTTNALILCPHGGKGTTTPSDPKWQISGGFVAVEGDTGVLDCPFAPLPCAGYQLRSMGLNATRIDNRKVILVTDFNQSVTGLPLTMMETHQVIDDSTPAPIPPGQAVPPLPPAMNDVAKPVVTCVPSGLAFNSTTALPPTLSAAFTLSTAYPLSWILTLINEPEKTNADLTNGLSPALTLQPSGGVWDVPTQTITLSMTVAFLGTLAPGLHRFFMTGVSQRGLTGFAEMVLTVI
jgi:hypothetical protein